MESESENPFSCFSCLFGASAFFSGGCGSLSRAGVGGGYVRNERVHGKVGHAYSRRSAQPIQPQRAQPTKT
jgi:hypothetical protein